MLPIAKLRFHQQVAWERQREHVTRNSTFYRNLWDGQTPPLDLRDLPALPLSSKAQLRISQADHPPFGNYLASAHTEVTRLHRTSGTTGQAMNLALSARDCEITEIVGGRSHRAAGLTPDHTVVLYLELIDPDTEGPLPFEPGSEGELVLTHLERECQPLVRFRSGDIIAVDETKPCQCGRTGMRFRVVGRSDDMVTVRGLNIFPTAVAAVIGEFIELSGDYRIELTREPPYDFLPVQVELATGHRVPAGLGEKIGHAIKTKLGATARITVLPAASFPVTEGKTKRVVRTYA